jgi:hypothetical protein
MAGLHRTAVGQLERGERVARTDTLVKLCCSLGVSSEELLAGLGWRPQQLFVGELEIEDDDSSEESKAMPAKEEIEPARERPKREPARRSEVQQ